MFFYISSEGHAATTFLSKAIDLHPNFVCFHANRTIPPAISEEGCIEYFGRDIANIWGSQEVAKNLAVALKQCDTHSSKSFGSVHTVFGLTAKEPIERMGGRFGGVIRNPIDQFSSMMTAFTPRALTDKAVGVDFKSSFTYQDVLNQLDHNLLKKLVMSNLQTTTPFDIKVLLTKIEKRILKRFGRFSDQIDQVSSDSLSFENLFLLSDSFLMHHRMAQCLSDNFKRISRDHLSFIENLPGSQIWVFNEFTDGFIGFARSFEQFFGIPYEESLKPLFGSLGDVQKHVEKRNSVGVTWNGFPSFVRDLFSSKLFAHKHVMEFYKNRDVLKLTDL